MAGRWNPSVRVRAKEVGNVSGKGGMANGKGGMSALQQRGPKEENRYISKEMNKEIESGHTIFCFLGPLLDPRSE
jgi:hypothetical protein